MWNLEIFGFSLFNIVYSVFIFSFGGWIWETSYCSIREKSFINRGFLNGPIIPIYGIGGTLVYIILAPLSSNIVIIFIAGMLLATALEYVTSLLMEVIFHASWWDYSRRKLNFQGRICLLASLFWGILSVIDVFILGPFVMGVIEKVPRRAGELVAVFLIIAMTVDITVTCVYTLQLTKRANRLSKLREELFSYLLSTRLVEKTGELKQAFGEFSITKLSGKRDLAITELTKRFRASLLKEMSEEEIESRVNHFKCELESKFKNFQAKYKLDVHDENVVHKRLIKAFPNLRFKKGRYFLQELKERINLRNEKKD